MVEEHHSSGTPFAHHPGDPSNGSAAAHREDGLPAGGRRLVFNGIDGGSGQYLIPPLTEADLLDILREKPREEDRAVPRGFEGDVKDLAATGWGVVFPSGSDPAVREALEPLLRLRREQATAEDPRYFRCCELAPGETAEKFLRCRKVSWGPVRPEEMPYYLLLVGGPEEIPFDVQFQLSLDHAVGRLAFETADEYRRYAEGVVAVETGRVSRPRRAAFFGVANPDDAATRLSAERLAQPLARAVAEAHPEWEVQSCLGEEATKARLGGILDEAPAVLFTAGHGLGFPAGDARQEELQGALLTAEWPGPRWWRAPIPEEFCFAGRDVSGTADLAGLVAFCFGCYAAGTPREDSFAVRGGGLLEKVATKWVAPRPLVSRLPQRLLAHPGGGALGVIGHVDRAWGYSFVDVSRAQTGVFEATFGRLLEGWPLGAAMKYFGLRYGQLAAELTRLLERAKLNREVDPEEAIALWTAHNDARAYVVLGDPAARIAVSEVVS